MIGDQQLEHAGRHNEVPKSYDQWRWGYGLRSGGETQVCIENYWGNEPGNLEERTELAKLRVVNAMVMPVGCDA